MIFKLIEPTFKAFCFRTRTGKENDNQKKWVYNKAVKKHPPVFIRNSKGQADAVAEF